MNALLLSVALLAPAQQPSPKLNPNDIGVLPVGADGKPLNLDFETGDLKDWTAEGEAFKGQPIKGDTVFPRRPDSRSRNQGQFWIGGYEKFGDKPTGTLTSVPFKVTHPWASFLVGGGPHPKETYVEIVCGKNVIVSTPGREMEDMERVIVDLAKFKDKEIFIRIVDKHTAHWGHINFDDFRFHAEKPTFPDRPKVEPPPPADVYKFAGLKPEEAAKAMTVPPGFSVSVFAAEPDVHQPIAFCIDHRGRLWVVEAYTYPRRHPEKGPIIPDKKLGDKIVIFEDTDGDGKFDKRTVFMEGLNMVSGIEVGFGGVWVGAAPYLLFIPHDEKTDKAGEVKILLDGWGYRDTHETLNSFIWGPDGWLYGCHGVFTYSNVGKPGTPDKDRVYIDAGIWRYHPTRHVFEVFAHGTSNPWGLDYNANGDFFIEACVIPHMYHIIQGGRYQRQAGPHVNPYTFDDIKTIAVHRHYVGATPHGGNGRSDSAGGGHAHCGLMCYQGGTWPKEYHGKLFMGNLHGHRINVDVITPKGSGYVADRNPDFLLTHDKWSIPIAMKYGPDGNVYLLDWYDKQICHDGNPEKWDRTNGRIYKISHKDAKPVKDVDLSKATWAELVKYQEHGNDWYARTARRIMQERAATIRYIPGGPPQPADYTDALKALKTLANEHKDAAIRLRAFWALHATKGLNHAISQFFSTKQPVVLQAWSLRLGFDNGEIVLPDLLKAAASDSPLLRREVATFLMQVGLGLGGMDDPNAWLILDALLSHAEDATDHNLPYLYWYVLERYVAEKPLKGLQVAANGKIPFVFQSAARRVGAIGTPESLNLLVERLGNTLGDNGRTTTDAQRLAYLAGLQEATRGRRQVPMPEGWTRAFEALTRSEDAGIRNQAMALAVVFGDKNVLAAFRKVLADAKADTAARLAALTALVDARDADTVPLLQAAISDKDLRSAALRGLASFDDAKTPGTILASYGTFTAAEKRDAVSTLAARAGFARELMAAVAAKKVPATDIPAEVVRQLRGFEDAALNKQIAELWGSVRESPAERKALIAGWKKRLTAATAPPGDVNLGRAVFAKTCLNCHTLYAVGGKVGPEITGANRGSIDYLLENILDPSAVIPKEYAATRIVLNDDRSIIGIVKSEVNGVLTVQTDRETLNIAVGDVQSRKPSELSMMPDDILKQVNEHEFRSLIAYLQTQSQVPLLATADNAKDFFNGKDLTGWDGDKELWKVDNGEIVGKTATGLKRNNFLVSQTAVQNFKLSLKVKLTPNKENSGIQFRSVPLPDGEMRGPQADIGAGWWGKLYEESGRGILAKEGGEKFVKPDEWNDYVVEAIGGTVKIWINGNLCTDITDEKLSLRGVVGFQIHSGGPMEVRFKDIKLEVLK